MNIAEERELNVPLFERVREEITKHHGQVFAGAGKISCFLLCHEFGQRSKSQGFLFVRAAAVCVTEGVCIQAHSALESPQMVARGPNSWKWLVIKVLSSRLHLQEARDDISLHKFLEMGKVKNTASYTRYLIPKARHSRKHREIKGIKQLGL